jgi:hypothetical protein
MDKNESEQQIFKTKTLAKLNNNENSRLVLNNKPISIEHLCILLVDNNNYQVDELFIFTFFCKLTFIYLFNITK